MKQTDWKRRYNNLLDDYRKQNRWLTHELAEIRRHYPNIDTLFTQLIDLIDAADPQRAAPITISRHRGNINGLEERGGDVTLKGGFDIRPAQDRIREINRQLNRLAQQVFEGLDTTGYRHVNPVLSQTRRCRHKDCPEAGRRQYGMNIDGTRVCRGCGRELPKGTR